MFAAKENVFNSENAIHNHFLLSLVQMHTPTNKMKLKNTLPIPTQFSTTVFNKPFFQISHVINGEAEKFKRKAKTISVERLRSISVSCAWTSNQSSLIDLFKIRLFTIFKKLIHPLPICY